MVKKVNITNKDNENVDEDKAFIDYELVFSAYQNQDNERWVLNLDIIDVDDRLVEIFGQREYETYQDAIIDCYGIGDLLGVNLADTKTEIYLYFWKTDKEDYEKVVMLFDGQDFYKKQ